VLEVDTVAADVPVAAPGVAGGGVVDWARRSSKNAGARVNAKTNARIPFRVGWSMV